MINTILIDDNHNDLNHLNDLCSKIETINVLNTFINPLNAFNWLLNNNVDLIITDIDMPQINGIDMIKQLKHKPLIIFTSAHQKYAVKSFDIRPIHYLIKPLKIENLLIAFDRVKNKLTNQKMDTEFIFVLNNKEYIKLKYNQIFYIKAEGNFVKIFTENKKLLILSNLTQFTKQLPNNQFLRIHKTYTININKIEKYTPEHIVINSQIIPFGNSYKTIVTKKLKELTIKRST